MGFFNRAPRVNSETKSSELMLGEPMIEHLDNDEPMNGEQVAEQPRTAGDPAEPLNELAQGWDQPAQTAAATASEPAPAPDPEPASEPEPEPLATAQPATEPAAAPVPPEVDDEELRITATEALAPSRQLYTSPGKAADPGRERRATVISFANQKGGVAKTTSTLNLAVAFAESGHKVLCVDLDPQGNLTMSQGIDPDRVEKSMFDVLVHHIPLVEVIQSREIDIAVASIDLAGAEIAMSTQIGRERSLEKAIKGVENDYDFVCIDTPPSLGLLTVNALTASDKVIVPVQCEYLSMRGLLQLQNTLEMIKENLNPRVEIEGILPTMLDSRTVHAKEAVAILEENFGDLVFKSRIRKAIKFAEAPVRGASLLKYDPKSNAADYYRDLAKEVLTNGAS
jgi:chromosome partitioning protein